ncbi:nucleotide exchange factor GrpE [uncultured Paludibaculum sp.]|uniref:nucleotide exchange factor GrpE n=1 Tax=uncultured Paludibaculum sp. TaxID=1765020 RepID=UPI002AABDF7D|nr:nucleotide exchange factor GrpE [uncultured Paludibaculum sp.]
MSQPDRELILSRFTDWLDLALTREGAPPGIPEELLDASAGAPETDLYAVQAALTALTQEVRLQGRSFKQLSETVAPISEMAPALNSAAGQARREARSEVLDLLLDLRDRLLRGEETARASAATLVVPRRWWHRKEGPDSGAVVAALREGYLLTLGRLEEALVTFGVSEIECTGRPFDSSIMHAVGIEETESMEDGTVVSVLRRGYEWDGVVYRPADVRVARRPDAKREQSNG